MKMFEGSHRLTKKYIPLSVASSFKQSVWLLIALLASLRGIPDGLRELVPMWLIIIGFFVLWLIVFSIIYSIAYIRFSWEITDDELHIYKGLINRKRMHVPYKRIHSANIDAGIFDRMFGVVTLKMDTAGGSGKGADAQIPALERKVAEEIKNEIFRRKKISEDGLDPNSSSDLRENIDYESERLNSDIGVYFQGKDSNLGKVENEKGARKYSISVFELILTGLSSGSTLLIIFSTLAALSPLVGLLTPDPEAFYNSIGDVILQLFNYGAVYLIVIVLIILLFAMIFSALGKMVTLWNFTIRREGGSLEISRGLLSKRNSSISVARIQAVRLRQGILRRMIGYSEISIERVMTVMENQNNSASQVEKQIHPFIKKSKVDEFMRAMLPEFAEAPMDERLNGLSRVALRRSFLRYARRSLIYLIIPLSAVFIMVRTFAADIGDSATIIQILTASVCLAVLIFIMITAYFTYKGRAVGYDEKMLCMKEGAYSRNYTFIPRRKIQYAVKAQNPFQRLSKVATINARSAAPTMRWVSTIDVDEDYADEWLHWVESYKANK